MTSQSSPDTLLLIEEVARRLRAPEATLRYWRQTGTGPKSAKLGRRIVYRESDVQAWVDQQFANDRPTPAA